MNYKCFWTHPSQSLLQKIWKYHRGAWAFRQAPQIGRARYILDTQLSSPHWASLPARSSFCDTWEKKCSWKGGQSFCQVKGGQNFCQVKGGKNFCPPLHQHFFYHVTDEIPTKISLALKSCSKILQYEGTIQETADQNLISGFLNCSEWRMVLCTILA